jgi:PAS domain S-box-containing protein
MKKLDILINETLSFIEQNNKTVQNSSFLKNAAKHIAALFNISYVFIDKYSIKEPTILKSVVYYKKGIFTESIAYNIKNTPCEHVVNKKTAIFPKNLQILFPKDVALKQMNAQSYIGIPLWGSNGNPIGLISIIHEQPLTNTKPFEVILQILAIKVAQILEKEILASEITAKNNNLKRVEASNKINQEKFSKAFHNHTVAMEIVDMDTGKRLEANESFLKLLEFSKEELQKGSIYSNKRILNPELMNFNFLKLKKQGYFKNASFNILSKKGSIKNLLVSGTVLNINKQNLTILSFIDVTKQKHFDEILKKSEEKFKQLANLTFEGIIIHNNGITIDVNHSFEKLFGYTKDELIGKDTIKFLYPKKYHQIILEHRNNKQSPILEIEGIKKDGTIFPIEIEGRDVITDDNKKIRVGALRDLTERTKNKEQTLKLSTAIEQSSNTIVITDVHGIIEYVNPKFTRQTGYTFEQAIGQTPRVLKSGNQPKQFYTHLWKTISSGKTWSGEFCNKTKKGDLFWEQATITPIKNNEGKIINYLAVKEDISDRKESEKKLNEAFEILKNSEDYLSTILESMNEGFWAVDLNNITTEVNPKMCQILGVNEDDVVGQPVSKFLDATNYQILIDEEEKRNDHVSSQYEIAFKNSKGNNIPCLVNTTPIFNSQGKVIGSFGMISDISSLKNAIALTENQNNELQKLSKELSYNNALLKESNLRFKNLFEHSPVSIWEQDYTKVIQLVNQKKLEVTNFEDYLNKHPDFVKECISKIAILDVNTITKELFGINNVKELKKHFENTDSHIALKAIKSELIAIAQGENEFNYITQLKNKAGKRIDVIVNSVIIDSKGKAIASVIDISPITDAEKKLKQSEKKFRELYEKSGDAIMIGRNGRFTDLNKAALQLFGYTSKEKFLKTKIADLYPKLQPDGMDSYVKSNEMLAIAFKEGTHRFEFTHKKENGKTFPAEILLTAISNKKGNKILHGVLRDITERKKVLKDLTIAKEKAEESDRLKTEFLNNMSHEIRTPMNGILGFSEMLAHADLDEQKRTNYINIIQSSGKQLLRVIDDILEISRLGTHQVKVIEDKVCLNDLLFELFSIFDIRAKENRTPLYLKKQLSDIESIIITDASKLNKIISNLIENAIKFTNKGIIEFGYTIVNKSNKPQLQLYVKDTGIGIKPEKHQLIFERFQQAEKELVKNVGGLGLGLAIARENTTLLGGTISVESNIMSGSTFYVNIPYTPVHPVKINSNKAPKLTILIAEDEEINFMFLETLLKSIMKLDCTILHAKNGREAVEICENNPTIDMVLMDLKMPLLNGFLATKQIRKFNKSVPIIAQTAYSTLKDKEESLKMGCNNFISKPIKKEEFVEVVNSYLIEKGVAN